MSCWAVVLAGGRGRRAGLPKQFASLGDRRCLDWTLAAATAVCDATCLVVPVDHVESQTTARTVVPGGASHVASLRAGVDAVPPDVETILVASPSHPLGSLALYRAVRAARSGSIDAVGARRPLPDALKRVASDGVHTLERSDLVTVQMPMAFRAEVLRAGLARVDAPTASEGLELAERVGATIAFVEGEATNLHVTTVEDLDLARALLPHLDGRLAR